MLDFKCSIISFFDTTTSKAVIHILLFVLILVNYQEIVKNILLHQQH